jgi:hypothetical protein
MPREDAFFAEIGLGIGGEGIGGMAAETKTVKVKL